MGTSGRRMHALCVGLLAVATALSVAATAGAGTARRSAARDGSPPTWNSRYDWQGGDGYAGWHTATTAAGDYGLRPALGGEPGLWIWPLGGHRTYDTGDYAEWTLTAPGTTRLQTARLSVAWSNKLFAHHCVEIGLRDAGGAVLTRREQCAPPPQSPRDVVVADPAPNPTAKVLYFRVHVDCGGAASCSKTIPALDPTANGAYARLLAADLTLVDDDAPNAWGAGAFFDLADDYTNGSSSYGLTLDASDAGSGIVRTWLQRTGDGVVVSADAACDPRHRTDALDARICPADTSADTTVDTSALPEGRNEFAVDTVDVAGNTGAGDPWSVYVDRTAPLPAASFTSDSYDPSSGEWSVSWDPGTDPDLADGSPGSGVATSQVRYATDGSALGAWQDQEEAGVTVADARPGEQLTIEVREIDAVGNVSQPAGATLTLDASTPPPDPEQPLPDNFCKDDADAETCLFAGPTAAFRSLAARVAAADPPAVTRSYYEHDANTANLRAQGCAAAHSTARGLVIIDFGRLAYNGGEYGSYGLQTPPPFLSNTAIRKAAIAFAYGFVRCNGGRRGPIVLAVGTNNGCTDNDPDCHGSHLPPSFTTAGRRWNGIVEALHAWVAATPARRKAIEVAAANDIEPRYEGLSKTAEHTTAFELGYNAEPFPAAMYDFGSNEQGYWSDEVRYRLAYGMPRNFPVPQIYLTGMAGPWASTSKWGAEHGRYGRIAFQGVTSQYVAGAKDPNFGPNCGLSPQDGYNTLLQALNRDPATRQARMNYLTDVVCHS